MRTILALLLMAGVAVAQFDYVPHDWYNAPGDWELSEEIKGPALLAFLDNCGPGTNCHSFIAEYKTHLPTCLRFLDPKVIKDGREIPGHVVETGTPGEPDWEWQFQTDEIFTGPFIWKVTTIDVCPKVG
jgi:hypothetical protein